MDRNIHVANRQLGALLVALRKESVDRNVFAPHAAAGGTKSLSARRAWIEMLISAYVAVVPSVALRKESVDRNLSTLP